MPADLPNILIIDDQLAAIDGMRFDAIRRFRLHDPDNPNEVLKEKALAQVFFHPGRVSPEADFQTCLDSIQEKVKLRWNGRNGRWALILVDYDFSYCGNSQNANFSQFGRDIVRCLAEAFPWRPTWSGDRPRGRCDIPLVALSQSHQEAVERSVDPIGSLGFLNKVRATAEDFSDILFRFGLVADGALRFIKDKEVKPIREPAIIGNSPIILRMLLEARLQLCGHNPPQQATNSAPCFRSAMRSKLSSRSASPDQDIRNAIKSLSTNTDADAGEAILRALRGPRILILGERGSGKGMFARYMHDHSPLVTQSKQEVPYERVQLDGISENLVESALFGHVRGAFTGAKSWRPGMFMSACGGTAFVDEIANVDPEKLRKLLSSIGDGVFSHVGAEEVQIPVSCQIICATNKPVPDMVRTGDFPEDLFDRMTGVFRLPPLRDYEAAEREELFKYFVSRQSKTMGRESPHQLNDSVSDWIRRDIHRWPGNVRELEILAQRVVSKRMHSGFIQLYDLELESEPLIHFSSSWDIEQLLKFLEGFSPNDNQREWTGKLEIIHQAFGRFSARVVLAAMEQSIAAQSERSRNQIPTKYLCEALGLSYDTTKTSQTWKRDAKSLIEGKTIASVVEKECNRRSASCPLKI